MTARTIGELAAEMYSSPPATSLPGSTGAHEPTPEGKHRSNTQLAAAMFPDQAIEVPPEIAAIRQGQDAPALAYPAFDQMLMKASGGPPTPTRRALAMEITRIAHDVGLNEAEAAAMVSRTASAKALTGEALKEAQEAVLYTLQDEFGERAGEALAAGQALARRDPRWAKLLRDSGLGNDPETILHHARQAMKGKT